LTLCQRGRVLTDCQREGIFGESLQARFESGRFLLRPSLSAYNRAVPPSTDTTSGLEERGVGLGVRLPVILESNVYRSILQVGLETQLRETRQYNGGLTGRTPYSTRLMPEPRLALRYRTQQNRRDVIPNTGVTLNVQGSFDSWVEGLRSGTDGRHHAVPRKSKTRWGADSRRTATARGRCVRISRNGPDVATGREKRHGQSPSAHSFISGGTHFGQ